MKFVEAEAKTVDEAIFKGLKDLNRSIDEVTINILDEGTKGFLSIGAKPARVLLTVKGPEAGSPTAFLQELFEKMNLSAEIEETVNEKDITVNLSGDRVGTIIGHRGETLDAIQYLTGLAVNRNRQDYVRVVVDAENYRDKREKSLVKLANNMASRVRRTGRRVALEPMNPFERRVLHATLQDNEYVTTRSEGEEPNRRVVILPKK
jgi:spoIIIJ-associated protein